MILRFDDLKPSEPVHIEIGGVPVCVVRTDDDEVYAVSDVCTHEYALMSEGWVSGRAIECPRHGSEFDLRTGEALTLPATQALPVYTVRRDGSDVIVEVSGS